MALLRWFWWRSVIGRFLFYISEVDFFPLG